jgi:hypothetical protein
MSTTTNRMNTHNTQNYRYSLQFTTVPTSTLWVAYHKSHHISTFVKKRIATSKHLYHNKLPLTTEWSSTLYSIRSACLDETAALKGCFIIPVVMDDPNSITMDISLIHRKWKRQSANDNLPTKLHCYKWLQHHVKL